MKKYLAVLLLLFCSIASFAQLKREAYGFKLGSSIADARTVFRSKGLAIRSSEFLYGNYYKADGNFNFVGVPWNSITITTQNDTVTAIMFGYKSKDGETSGDYVLKLTENLTKKYLLYVIGEPKLDVSDTKIEFSVTMADDQGTALSFSGIVRMYGESSFQLIYADVESFNKATEKAYDEL